MGWLKKIIHGSESSSVTDLPPAWSTAPEPSHTDGRFADATTDSFNAGEAFCERYLPEGPHLLPSDVVERLDAQGARAWGLVEPTTPSFLGSVSATPGDTKGGQGTVLVETHGNCEDSCLLSNLPMAAGLYNIGGKEGWYYEIAIHEMDGTIALGTAVRPYPTFRLPGWNRLSMALHLDDLRKFCEDPNGGQDYPHLPSLSPGDVVGCGYHYASTSLFFTYNGARLPTAFSGLYVDRERWDVYAAIGTCGRTRWEINFGAAPFKWKEGNEWAWRAEGSIGRLSGPSGGPSGFGGGDELPTYSEARFAQ